MITTMAQLEQKLQKADRKQAMLYLFCNFISLMLITAYAAMMFSNTVQTIFPEGGDSRKQMIAIFVLTLFGCTVFTVYASSLFFRKKSRQLGVLMALGASKKKLSRGLLREVLWLSIASSFLGILAGIPFVLLLWNSFRLFLANTDEMRLSLNPAFLLISLLFFLLIVVCSCITALRYLRRTDILDTIQEEHKNEPVKDLGRWCGPAGILLLLAGAVSGYFAPGIYMDQFNAMPPLWTKLFYIPAFIGLYMIMLHTIVHGWIPHKKALCKNVISKSMMKFQGKQTVNSLLVCTVLIAGSAFGIFYLPIMLSGNITKTSGYSYSYSFAYRSDQDIPKQEQIREIASKYDLGIKDYKEGDYTVLGMDGTQEVSDSETTWHYEYSRLLSEGRFWPESDYQRMTGQTIDVTPGEYMAVRGTDGTGSYNISSASTLLTNMSTRQELPVSFGGYLAFNSMNTRAPFYVLDDQDYASISQGATPDWKERLVLFNVDGEDSYEFADELFLAIVNANGPECELPYYYDRVQKIASQEKGETYWGDTDEMTQISFQAPDSSDFRSGWVYMPLFRMLDQQDFLRTFAVFLMMFLFIAIVCLMAALIISYTRCQTIALNNRYIFDDLYRLGASPAFLTREIKVQCSKVFRIPAVVGMTIIYVLFCGIMYVNDNRFTVSELLGLLFCLGVLLLFAVIIYLVYRFTVKKLRTQLGIQ